MRSRVYLLPVALVALTFTLSGCSWFKKDAAVSGPADEGPTVELVTNTPIEPIAPQVQKAIERGEAFKYTENKDFKRPSYVQSAQKGPAFVFGDVMFQFIYQPNANFFLGPLSGANAPSVRWAGIIATNDKQESWDKYFEIKNEDTVLEAGATKYNPVGMFVKNKRLYIDTVDDRGAGAGEGNLIRWFSDDGGRIWHQENTYYFVPDKYFINKTSPEGGINPDSVVAR